MHQKLLAFYILMILSLSACEQKQGEPVDMGYEYYPVEENVYHIYQVDSIIWDDFYTPPQVDTFSYKVKKVIKSDFQDNEGRTVYRVERFVKQNDTLDWRMDKVFTLLKDSAKIVKTIDNRTFIKLVFPIDIGSTWDANIYNPENPNEYEITEEEGSFQVDDKTFHNTVNVEQKNQKTLISNDIANEVYAPDVGMIYKQDISQELDISTGEVESGYKYTYKLLEYAN